jgi:hypothetical protein
VVEKAYEKRGYIGKQVQNRAQAQGYDGIMQYRDGELMEVLPFSSNQVKSAIGNEGTYDIYSPELNKAKGGVVSMDKGGTPENIFGVAETPEQEFQRYLRMLRINASGGKDPYGINVGGRLGINIPVRENVSLEPYVQGFAFKPDGGKLINGGVGGANLNIRFNNGGIVSDDAMRMAVMNKQLRNYHG